MKNEKQIREILDTFGINNQVMKTLEELDELKEVLETMNIENILPIEKEQLASEIADVWIMCQQLIVYYNLSDIVKNEINYKTNRTIQRIGTGFYTK
jgi:regulator of replication initiation timing